MADVKDEEHLENPINYQPENPPNEIPTAAETEIINPNQKTNNMEVHKHPHHITHSKKRGEYFLEFFMIFLAVFLGFLTENFREHQVEKERGKQYIESFYKDLISDTLTFSNLIASNVEKIEGLNGIFECYDVIMKEWKSTSCLVRILNNSQGYFGIILSDGTIQQLKNAGGFRLLDKDDRDSIILYDKATQGRLEFQSTALQQSQDEVRSTASLLKDFKANEYIFKKAFGADSSLTEIPILFSNDKALLNKYFNELLRYRSMIQMQQNNLVTMKELATRLIRYFGDKYQFR